MRFAILAVLSAAVLSACATPPNASSATTAYAAAAEACAKRGGSLVPAMGDVRQTDRCHALAAPNVYQPPLRQTQ